jgi:hypothetical protein
VVLVDVAQRPRHAVLGGETGETRERPQAHAG